MEEKTILFYCLKGLENFMMPVAKGLTGDYKVMTNINDLGHLTPNSLQGIDVIWIEWANEMSIHITKMIAGMNLGSNKPRVIIRLHSYEAFVLEYLQNIAWTVVDDIIFVAPHIKKIVNKYAQENFIFIPSRQHVVLNGINQIEFPFDTNRKDSSFEKAGKDIAYVGYLNHKKGPMLLLPAFNELYRKNNDFKLHIAGTFQEPRYSLYYKQMIKEWGLEKNVLFYGWVEDVSAFLKDKQYIINSSVLEGCPVGMAEAMSMGLKPLIHNFVGARGLYPKEYIWNDIRELKQMVFNKPIAPKEYHNYVSKTFHYDRKINEIKSIIERQ